MGASKPPTTLLGLLQHTNHSHVMLSKIHANLDRARHFNHLQPICMRTVISYAGGKEAMITVADKCVADGEIETVCLVGW